MEVISSIYNSGYNIKKFYLGSRELNLAYLGNQVIYDEVIGDNDLNYILYEFYGSDTLPNTVEAPVKSAILKGSTKYRDIDTGDILDTFDETKNLELVSVKMPVLTTSNEDGTKTNILSSNEEVHLRKVDGTKDELNLLTGELTQRTGEIVLDGSEDWIRSNMANSSLFYTSLNNLVHKTDYLNSISCDKFTVHANEATLHDSISLNGITAYADVTDTYPNENWLYIKYADSECSVEKFKQWLSQNPTTVQYELATESVKTVDLTIVDQDGKTINKLNSFNGTTHVSTEAAENSIYPTIAIEVATE